MDWRNPFEDFRDKYLSFNDVRAYKLWVWRYGLIPYKEDELSTYTSTIANVLGRVPDPPFVWAYRDMGVKKGIQPWITKFFNAKFSIHIGVSIWKRWLPLPFVGICYRINDANYFQMGGFFGPDGEADKETGLFAKCVICGKFRFANFITEFTEGGNYDVYGDYEGAI